MEAPTRMTMKVVEEGPYRFVGTGQGTKIKFLSRNGQNVTIPLENETKHEWHKGFQCLQQNT